MLNLSRYRLNNFLSVTELWSRFACGADFEMLTNYILRINQHNETWEILRELSMCLKEMCDYQLFGFALKKIGKTEIWIDPRTSDTKFIDFIAGDCECQKNDLAIRYFEAKDQEERRNFDAFDTKNLISYHVINNNFIARLYIIPKKKLRRHHDAIISTIIKSVTIALEKNLSILDLKNAAAVDPLTNCYNRRALCDFLGRDIAAARRQNSELSVMMIDLDDFKRINDIHGHLAGDAVLREFSSLISSVVRRSDYLARYGGEEFVLVLPATSLYNAVQLAEKLRKCVEACEIIHDGQKISVTASFGIASLESKKTVESLLHEADTRLYTAKANGKNSVVPAFFPCTAGKPFSPKKPLRKYAAGM